MVNRNGQVLLRALQTFRRPATFNEIVSHIADAGGVPPNNVRGLIKETLNGGVRYGFIQRSNRKYSVTSVVTDVAEIVEEVNKECAEAEKDGEKRDDNRNDEVEEEDIKRKKSKRKNSDIGLSIVGAASLKEDNKESAEAESEAGNDGEGKKDNNQNIGMEEDSKRRKVGKCDILEEVNKECAEAGAENGDEEKEQSQADEMKEMDQTVRQKKGIQNTGAAVRSDK